MERCVHGLDGRFCSLCNKPERASGKDAATLAEILAFLNHERVRISTRAQGLCVEIDAQSVIG